MELLIARQLQWEGLHHSVETKGCPVVRYPPRTTPPGSKVIKPRVERAVRHLKWGELVNGKFFVSEGAAALKEFGTPVSMRVLYLVSSAIAEEFFLL
jgi:hypothetical protein